MKSLDRDSAGQAAGFGGSAFRAGTGGAGRLDLWKISVNSPPAGPETCGAGGRMGSAPAGWKNCVNDPSVVAAPQSGMAAGGAAPGGAAAGGAGNLGASADFSGWNICVNDPPSSAAKMLGPFAVGAFGGGPPANN